MPLSTSIPRRALKHTRAIHIEAFVRDDELWELDAHITDTKTRDIELSSGTLPAGQPLHSLWLRLTLDRQFTIVAVETHSEAAPYANECEISPAYNRLIGLNLLKGFRYDLKQRMGGDKGCTHLTELAQLLPTAAIQAFGGERDSAGKSVFSIENQKPFQLDRCHALRTDGSVVAKFYPKWAVTHVEKEPLEVNLLEKEKSS
ncbi:DUF2889 domain-containing protein [Glaciimonas soli]|uniref:DUF2889 domain-containing protein n=1 Tax=Glaciimonas soli TaxID=2590999 RepID=A0A843YXJ6_9BURK|nr:DUF2889 domain-containing protein [Glaciimonas soli]MQR01922.1 DUF2889 domain-containing protein [Glaciimonas soli]